MRRRDPGPAPQPLELERAAEREAWRLIGPALSRAAGAIFQDVVAQARDARTRRDRAAANDADDLGGPFKRGRLIAERLLNSAEVEAMAERSAKRGGRYADAQVGDAIKAVIGVDPLALEPELASVVRARAKEHSALIRTVPARFFRDLERQVVEVVRTGTLTRDLEEELRERFYSGLPLTKARSYAKRLARDQVGKTVSAVTEHRQTDLGITHYVWATAKDERVRGNPSGKYPNARPSHYAREGVTFAWAKPPEGGHPGQAIQCRCFAKPVIPAQTADKLRADAREEDAPRARRAPPQRQQLVAQPRLPLGPAGDPVPVLSSPAALQLVPESTRDVRARARLVARAQAKGEAEDRARERAALAKVDRSVAAAWKATNRANDAATRAQEAALRLHWARSRREGAQAQVDRTAAAKRAALSRRR